MLFSLFPAASILALVSAATTTNPYATYPSVAHTASINGFADPIYGDLPSCAQPCVEESTSSTPCPYWDTGCLCVMTTWASDVADCIAENCSGDDVVVATSLAISACSAAGVWDPYWIIDASASASLSSAAAVQPSTSATTSSTSASTTEETTSSTASSTGASSAPTSTEETTSSTGASSTGASSTAAPSSGASSSASSKASSAEGSVTSAAPSSEASAETASVSLVFTGGAAAARVAGVAGVAAGFMMLL